MKQAEYKKEEQVYGRIVLAFSRAPTDVKSVES